MFSRASDTPIKRILLVRTDRLGDVLLTLPMLPVLRACFPEAHIAMLLRRYTGEVVIGNPHVDEIIWYDRDHELVPFNEMTATLRQRRFDAAIVVYPRIRLAWLLFRSGIPLRIGTGYRYYSLLFNRRVYEHRKDAKKHEVEYNLNLLQQLHCAPQQGYVPEFYITIPKETRATVRALMEQHRLAAGKFAVLHPGSGGSAREWSTQQFGELAGRLRDENGFRIVVTGGRGEERKVSEVAEASRIDVVQITGELNLLEFAALIQEAALFVSNSTGPLHLAVTVGTPVVGLYPQHTPMSARRWGPYTDLKAVLEPDKPKDCTTCFDANVPCECMQSIPVDLVFRSAQDVLRKAKNRGEVHHAE